MTINIIGFWCCALVLSGAISSPIAQTANPATQSNSSSRDRELAARFAPVIYQALGENPRSDYITNFDFDGDWRGNNNWENAAGKTFPLRAYVYFSVCQTSTHYFLHYALFHPRDYKGGERKGLILSELIREGMKRGAEYDPTGLADEAGVAHENDLEGVLIVVARSGEDLDKATPEYVETFGHDHFALHRRTGAAANGVGVFDTEGQHVRLYVEPKGHGVAAYDGSEKQVGTKELLIYRFAGKADDPETSPDASVGYDLLPIQTTLWDKSLTGPEKNTSYGAFHDFGQVTINVMQGNRSVVKKIKVGKVGSAFLGDTGGINMAKPLWGWFDKSRRNDPLGIWFFDPAAIIRRDFNLNGFSTSYLGLPFWAAK